jgi:rRNA-processing protein FCF1
VTIRDPLRPPVCLVIDTNLLLLLLGYQCLLLESAKARERNRVLAQICGRADNLSPERFDDLWNLFRSAERRIVTQHVVAESYGLRKRLAFRKDLIWASAIGLLANPGIEEQSCQVGDLLREGYRDILAEIGPSDAGLILTAEQQKATIVTDDGPLAYWARVRSIPAVLLSQLGAS